MKKIFVLISSFTLFCCLFTISAKATNVIQECSSLENNSTIALTLSEYPAPTAGGLLKAVIIVLKFLGEVIGGEILVYLWNYEPNYNAVIKWANENGYDLSKLTVVSMRVVYDNGCWKPEFPANPFCKKISNEEE